jgi:hypothetical protein
MGSREAKNKKLNGEEQSATALLLAQLEEEVRKAVIDGTEDLVLTRLVDMTVRSIYSKRELFDNPLTEPVFYQRYFRSWVQDALDERDAMDKFHDQALEALGMLNRK